MNLLVQTPPFRRLSVFCACLLFLITIHAPSLRAEAFVAGLNAIERTHYATAYRSFKPLAEQGIAEAQNNLGFLYQNGLGVRRNYATAINWYKRAADKGLAEAEHNLGMLNYWGYGVAQDFSIARRWFNKAAKQNLAPSHYMLGLMFFQGEGVQISLDRARDHFAIAAIRGDVNGQYMLAHMILSGDAKSFFTPKEKASAFDFGALMDQEESELIAALAISLMASQGGQASANQLVEFLKFQLGDEQIAEATDLADRCTESEYKDCPVIQT